MEDDELLDLVNAKDQVVGTVMREEHHANIKKYNQKGQYWRGTGCFLVNSKKQVWIPKRQPWRKIAPDGLDFSMAEHVQSGESHIEAAVRGMNEELNLDVAHGELINLGKKLFKSFGCIMSIFIYKTDKFPDYSKDDYQDAWWMSVDELKQKLESGVRSKNALPFWLGELEGWLNDQKN